MKNEILNLTPENKIDEWSKIIIDNLKEGKEIYYIMDTETTGLYARGAKVDGYIRDRIIEIGIIVAVKKGSNSEFDLLLDKDNNEIFFHEYINFLRESEAELLTYNSKTYIPKEVTDITGISKAVLEGQINIPGTEKKLSETTPTFEEVYSFIEKFLILEHLNEFPKQIKMVAHNADFDYSFLNEEMQKIERSPIESFIEKVDTRTIAQEVISKSDFDDKNEQLKVKHIYLKNILNKKNILRNRELDYLKRVEEILESKLEELLLTEKRRSNKSTKINEIEKKLKIIKTNNSDYKKEYIENLLDIKSELMMTKNYSLDHLSILLNVKLERKLHGALLDSKILYLVYKKIVNLEKYKSSINHPNKEYKKLEKFKLTA